MGSTDATGDKPWDEANRFLSFFGTAAMNGCMILVRKWNRFLVIQGKCQNYRRKWQDPVPTFTLDRCNEDDANGKVEGGSGGIRPSRIYALTDVFTTNQSDPLSYPGEMVERIGGWLAGWLAGWDKRATSRHNRHVDIWTSRNLPSFTSFVALLR
jgi:hypothetical protein